MSYRLLFCIFSLGILGFSLGTLAKAPKTADSEIIIRESMVKISKQLGVTCNHCHDVQNFRSEKLPTFKTSKEHIRIVELLNTQGFKGKNAPRADCFMCHRGQAKPAYKEP